MSRLRNDSPALFRNEVQLLNLVTLKIQRGKWPGAEQGVVRVHGSFEPPKPK